MGGPLSSTAELFRRHLRADSPRRERVISWGVLPFVLLGVVGIAILPSDAQVERGRLLTVLFAVAAYEIGILAVLRSGRYSPVIPWLSTFIEASSTFAIVCVVTAPPDPLIVFASPAFIPWAALLVGSAVRLKPRLSFFAGLLSATELLGFHFLFLPRGSSLPSIVRTPTTVTRALLLLAAGIMGAMVSKHFLRRAEEALKAVREQDLMGKYLLHERLGAGGMAEVFRATYHPEGGFEKVVAIKRVLPELSKDEEFTRLFLEEARLCATLSHPNVVQVSDCGRFNESFILAMEFVEGVSLHRLLREQATPLPLAVASYVGAELTGALEYIHQRIGSDGAPLGLVHRDLNPANVLISRFGDVKLADFGVAQAANRVTQKPGEFWGKTRYAAPEQLRGEALDGRADLFALGITMLELVTGRRAVEGTEAQAARTLLQTDLPPASRSRPEVPPELDLIVATLLARDRAKRFGHAAQAHAAFLKLGGDAAPFPSGRKSLAQMVQAILQGGSAALPAASTGTPASSQETRTSDMRGRRS